MLRTSMVGRKPHGNKLLDIKLFPHVCSQPLFSNRSRLKSWWKRRDTKFKKAQTRQEISFHEEELLTEIELPSQDLSDLISLAW